MQVQRNSPSVSVSVSLSLLSLSVFVSLYLSVSFFLVLCLSLSVLSISCLSLPIGWTNLKRTLIMSFWRTSGKISLNVFFLKVIHSLWNTWENIENSKKTKVPHHPPPEADLVTMHILCPLAVPGVILSKPHLPHGAECADHWIWASPDRWLPSAAESILSLPWCSCCCVGQLVDTLWMFVERGMKSMPL